MNKLTKTALLLVGGMVTSYVASLLTSPKERNKAKRQIQTVIERVDWDDVSQRVLGPSNTELQQQLKKIISAFAAKIQTIKLGAQETINKATSKEYDQMVDSLTKKLEKEEVFTKSQLKKLADYLRNDFRLVEG
jgi:hypothetical protein